jgi:hypothetical protein
MPSLEYEYSHFCAFKDLNGWNVFGHLRAAVTTRQAGCRFRPGHYSEAGVLTQMISVGTFPGLANPCGRLDEKWKESPSVRW